MTLSRAVAALALVATATACAAVGKPIGDQFDPAADETPREVQSIVTASTAERSGVVLQPVDGEIGQSDSLTTSTTAPGATSTTAPSVPAGESTTTTTTAVETIDLDAVFDALDALEGMFGELEAEVESIDLEEGENP